MSWPNSLKLQEVALSGSWPGAKEHCFSLCVHVKEFPCCSHTMPPPTWWMSSLPTEALNASASVPRKSHLRSPWSHSSMASLESSVSQADSHTGKWQVWEYNNLCLSLNGNNRFTCRTQACTCCEQKVRAKSTFCFFSWFQRQYILNVYLDLKFYHIRGCRRQGCKNPNWQPNLVLWQMWCDRRGKKHPEFLATVLQLRE